MTTKKKPARPSRGRAPIKASKLAPPKAGPSAGRRPAPVQASNPAPPAERRQAEAELQAMIVRIAPARARLMDALRRWMGRRLPTAHEMVYEYSGAVVISYSPSGRGYEGVFCLRAEADAVTLSFNNGKELPDPAGVLQGAGNQTRWIGLESASSLDRPEVARLMEEAIARNRVPFAPTGRGPLVIRPTAAGRRTRY